MKSILRYTGLVFFWVLIWGAGNTPAETLQDAVHYMLQTHPEVRAVAFNRLARDEEVKKARADYWPTLDLSYSYGINEEYVPNDANNETDIFVSGFNERFVRLNGNRDAEDHGKVDQDDDPIDQLEHPGSPLAAASAARMNSRGATCALPMQRASTTPKRLSPRRYS